MHPGLNSPTTTTSALPSIGLTLLSSKLTPNPSIPHSPPAKQGSTTERVYHGTHSDKDNPVSTITDLRQDHISPLILNDATTSATRGSAGKDLDDFLSEMPRGNEQSRDLTVSYDNRPSILVTLQTETDTPKTDIITNFKKSG